MGLGWRWWFQTDAGLVARVAIGALIFAGLALWDVWRHGRQATRWREYTFLIVVSLAAMAYGAVNDLVASSIFWEYFYYGKGIGSQMGGSVPPELGRLRWEACKVGLKATWSAGLIIAVALLLANNPRRGRRQLSYRQLLRFLPLIFIATAIGALAGGILGRHGLLTFTSGELRMLVRDQLFRPRQFMAVYGMNLGGYVGGLAATALAVWWIVRRRRAEAGPETVDAATSAVTSR